MPSKFDRIKLNREQDRRARFTNEQVTEMREMYSKGYTQKAIAEIFKTKQCTVCYIVSDKARQHLSEYKKENPSKRQTKDERNKYLRELRQYKKSLVLKGGDI